MKSNIFLFHSLIASCCYFLFSFFFFSYFYIIFYSFEWTCSKKWSSKPKGEKSENERRRKERKKYSCQIRLEIDDDDDCDAWMIHVVMIFFMKNLFLFDGGLFPFIYLLLLLFLFLRIYLSFTAIFFLSPTIQVKNMSERKFMEGTITCTQLLI